MITKHISSLSIFYSQHGAHVSPLHPCQKPILRVLLPPNQLISLKKTLLASPKSPSTSPLFLPQLGFAFSHSFQHPPSPSAYPKSLAFQCLPNPSLNTKHCLTLPLSTQFAARFTSYHFFPSFHCRLPPMAPTRRKGVSKAAAAAAACRQWKVGDLVLAKVKGFPAWPATVGSSLYFVNFCENFCLSFDCAV